MREGYIDYYERYSMEYPEIRGCCLCCPDSESECLCFDCKCTKCMWYENYEGDGWCEIASDRKTYYSEYSNEQIRNVTQCSNKAVFGQIGNKIGWVPISAINNEGYVKKWIVNKLKP